MAPNEHTQLSTSTVKSATRARFMFLLIGSLLFFISLVFLILVEVVNVYGVKRPVTD